MYLLTESNFVSCISQGHIHKTTHITSINQLTYQSMACLKFVPMRTFVFGMLSSVLQLSKWTYNYQTLFPEIISVSYHDLSDYIMGLVGLQSRERQVQSTVRSLHLGILQTIASPNRYSNIRFVYRYRYTCFI